MQLGSVFLLSIEDGFFKLMSELLLLFSDDNKIKMARKPGKKQNENSVGCTGKGKRRKGNVREG